jgi:hypothetical protein
LENKVVENLFVRGEDIDLVTDRDNHVTKVSRLLNVYKMKNIVIDGGLLVNLLQEKEDIDLAINRDGHATKVSRLVNVYIC